MRITDSCGNCLFWENRPEMQMDVNTGFCAMRDAFKNRKSQCRKFCRRCHGEVGALLENGMYLPNDCDDQELFDNDA